MTTSNRAANAATPTAATNTNNSTNNNNSGSNNNGSNNNSNSGRRNNNNNNNDDNRSRNDGQRRTNNQVQLTNPKNYEGSIPEVGGIIALKYEKFDKKLQFQVFMDKVSNYTLSNFKDGGDLTPLFKKQKNSTKSFDKKIISSPLTEEQKKDDLERDICKEKIKLFVTRDCNLTRNMEKVYGLIWGQCGAALHAKIKGLSDYEMSSSDLDIL